MLNFSIKMAFYLIYFDNLENKNPCPGKSISTSKINLKMTSIPSKIKILK
jgi:hypothetical protein